MEELNCGFFNSNWDNSMDQNDPFESALSSMVSSPTASNAMGNNVINGEKFELRELIGRLGSICNSGEISPQPNYKINGSNISCYATPTNSPPKLNLSTMESRGGNLQIPGINHFVSVPFQSDPGFAERAAKFSCFASKLDSGNLSRVSSNQILGSHENKEFGDSREISSISGQIPGGEIGLSLQNDANSRKRKSVQKGKGKANTPAKDPNVGSENSDTSGKRSKSDDGSANEKDKQSKDNNSKAQEPPKDYIHVRARRGQATDAHSLAERVRREKIGERMKFLQDLVPGCNKVTGKAVMLDEIINYVQSLQRQVEFLSMKLSTVNPRMDFNMESLVSKDIFQSRGSLPQNTYPSDCYMFPSQPNLHSAVPNGTEAALQMNHFNAVLGRNQLPPVDNFSETASQISTFWEDDLHIAIQMGYGQNQTQNSHGAQMKVEP